MADLPGAGFRLETARLVLRREIEGDRATWLSEINTPEVMEHLGGPKSAEKVAEDFDKMAAEGEFAWLLVAEKSEGTLIGKCGLGRIDTAAAPAELVGQVQVGWTVRADRWRRGYGREAAEAMLALAFGHYVLERVYAQTSERNRPSKRLMESLGMTRRADLDYHDPDYAPEDNPTVVYVLERRSWREAGR